MAKKETAHKDLQGLEETVVCFVYCSSEFISFFDNDSDLHMS